MLRRVAVGCAFIAAALVITALLLPSDGTKQILKLRGKFGAAAVLTTRSDHVSIIRQIALRNDRGETLTNAWIRRPRALHADYRIVVTYAGADTDDAILRLIAPKDDVVVMAVQYPWKPPHTLIGRLRGIYDIRQAAYRTVAGGILAVDYLTNGEHLDTHRIVLLGASLGSIFATIHGAIDNRVQQVVLVHGGASLSDVLEAQVHGRVPAWLGRALVRIALIPIDTFDPAHYVARISPRNLLIIAARNDPRFPADAIVAFFNRAQQPKELRWTNTGHVGKRKRQVVDVIMGEVNAYLDAQTKRKDVGGGG